VATVVVGLLRNHRLPPYTVLNVNIPNLPYEELKGFAVAPMGRSRWVEEFDERVDPRGNTYYWVDGELRLHEDAVPGNDVHRVNEGYVTLTPITLDLTDRDALQSMQAWEWSL
jgi:5'-nucleotidase